MGYDVIVVGARCAGAPLARFLAGAGKRVLLVDAAALPKDQPLSTHFITPFGMRILDELGLGDRVRAIAPPVGIMRIGMGGHFARVTVAQNKGGCCPRRLDLDALLLEGAREAGAEVRLRCRVVDLVRNGERVAGVVVDEDGVRSTLDAPLVVGADGRTSTIARLANAEEYNAYDGPRAGYWAYWPRPSWYASDARYEGGTIIEYEGTSFRFVFPTNTDQLIVGCIFPNTEVGAWKADCQGMLERNLRESPLFAPLVETPPISKTIGITSERFFFRQGTGPGWALVGDAGLFKDPSPGLGISDAFRDARALSAAIVEGGDLALERYWRQRDVESIELFYFARDMGELTYDNPLNRVLFAKLAADPALAQRLLDVFERRRSPYKAFGVGEVLRWTFGALLRGRFGVLGPFLRAGRTGMRVEKELQQRRKLREQLLLGAHTAGDDRPIDKAMAS